MELKPKYLFVFAFALLIFLQLFVNQFARFDTISQQQKPVFKSHPHWKGKFLILFYTPFFGARPWFRMREDFFTKCKCEVKNCQMSYDTSLLKYADAVIFHGRDMPNTQRLDYLSQFRKENQKWIYFILENPNNANKVKPLDKYFNWSLSYRLNSDFRIPYGKNERIIRKTNVSTTNYARGKTKQVAWFASHCGTGRDKLAKKMEQYGIRIEVGGACSRYYKHRIDCLRKHDCTKILNQYKFYFAAENGFCKDYITEKLFFQGYKGNTIPIVLGGANYSNPDLVIQGSYINPLQYRNPGEFAAYLKLVDNNDTLFNEHFKWKSNWKVVKSKKDGCETFACDICKELNYKRIKKERPLSEQINDDCIEPTRRYKAWLLAD